MQQETDATIERLANLSVESSKSRNGNAFFGVKQSDARAELEFLRFRRVFRRTVGEFLESQKDVERADDYRGSMDFYIDYAAYYKQRLAELGIEDEGALLNIANVSTLGFIGRKEAASQEKRVETLEFIDWLEQEGLLGQLIEPVRKRLYDLLPDEDEY